MYVATYVSDWLVDKVKRFLTGKLYRKRGLHKCIVCLTFYDFCLFARSRLPKSNWKDLVTLKSLMSPTDSKPYDQKFVTTR